MITQLRGTDASGSCSRQRAYVVACKAGPAAQERCERTAALINENIRSSKPRSIAEALPGAADTFYWDPRQQSTAGVLSTNMPMPSPVSRQPGRGPSPTYERRAKDAGQVRDAMILSVQEVVELMGFKRTLPKGTQVKQRLWAASLIQPNVAHLLMRCLHAAAPLPNGWREANTDESGRRVRGTDIAHDRDAPPPEWIVSASGNASGSAALLYALRLQQQKHQPNLTAAPPKLRGTLAWPLRAGRDLRNEVPPAIRRVAARGGE